MGHLPLFSGAAGAIAVNQISDGAITHVGIAMTFGLIVMTMIYAIGHISGAHFNPAVTIAFSFTRHFPKREILPYIGAQCLGAVCASFIHVVTLTAIVQQNFPEAVLDLGLTQPVDLKFQTAFVWEGLLTFFLMFVIMAVATDYRAVGKAAGMAIGGAVMFDALFGGPITGASMNPARSFGPALVAGQWQYFSAYVAGPILGACGGAFIYSFIRCQPQNKQAVKGCC